VNTDDLIRDLRSWVPTLARPKDEAELHNQILEKLKRRGLSPIDRGAIPNPDANGVSKPDVLVNSVDPQLLIEVKVGGEWRCASDAAWQLFQAAELLRRAGTTTRKLAIFGGEFGDPIVRQMLQALGIEWACVS
jgi:hypothetical protein